MRNQLFRSLPVLVDGADVVVALKDVDGANPFTLFLENMDIPATLRTKFGSKNANVRFVAVTPGAGGNSISVEITVAPDQAFATSVVGSDITIDLRCDHDGAPNQIVNDYIESINADPNVAALVRTVLALGSDGSAAMERVSATHAMVQTPLAGGSDAVATGAATVEYSPNGVRNYNQDDEPEDFPGPWVTHAAAGTALSTVAPNTIKAFQFVNVPMKGLRLTVDAGAYETRVVATAQRTLVP